MPVEEQFRLWSQEAVRWIRFRAEREDVQRELEAHLMDKLARLEAEGQAHKAAVAQAVEEMGDAETVGRALDRVHKRWLGWLWRVSQLAIALAITLVFASGMEGDLWFNGEAERDRSRGEYAAYGEYFDPAYASEYRFLGYGTMPELVESCGYTLSVPYAVWWEDEDGNCLLQMLVAADASLPWYKEPLGAVSRMEVIDSAGAVYPSFLADGAPEGGAVRVQSALEAYQKFFHFVFGLRVQLKERPDWVELRYPYGDNEWTLRVELEEGP